LKCNARYVTRGQDSFNSAKHPQQPLLCMASVSALTSLFLVHSRAIPALLLTGSSPLVYIYTSLQGTLSVDRDCAACRVLWQMGKAKPAKHTVSACFHSTMCMSAWPLKWLPADLHSCQPSLPLLLCRLQSSLPKPRQVVSPACWTRASHGLAGGTAALPVRSLALACKLERTQAHRVSFMQAATINAGGGKAGLQDRKGGAVGHARYK